MAQAELSQMDVQRLLSESQELRQENERLKALLAKYQDDIGELNSAQEALQQSEERFKTQYKNLPVPTYTWKWNGTDFVLIGFNDAADTQSHGQIRSIIGKTARTLYHDQPDILADFTRSLQERKTFKREMSYRLVTVTKVREFIVSYVFVPPDFILVYTDDVTESKRAQAALKENEERYRTLFENAPIGLGVADERGNLLAYNDAMMKPGGYSREDIARIGNVGALYVSNEERDNALALARKQGFLHRHEVRFKRKDGSEYAALLSLAPITLDGKRGWQAIAEDISGRKQAELALRESEARLRLALEAGAMGIWQWNMITHEIVWSDQHMRLFGVQPGHFGGKYEAFINCVHPDDHRKVEELTGMACRSRLPVQIDFRVIWPDKSIHWMTSKGQCAFDAAGQAVQMSGVVMEITERKLAEEQLRKSEESLLEAQRIASLGHWEWDVVRDHCYWSDELYRIAGKEKTGTPVSYDEFVAIVHPGDRKPVERAIADALAGRKPYSIDIRFVRPSGDVRTVHAQGRVFNDPDGKPNFMRGTVQDITERKRLEEQVFQAQKIESVGRLAGGVAHEFNNLLSGIMGYAELLALKLPPEHHEDVNGILRMSHRAAALTRQLLGFARKQPVEPRVLNLYELIVRMSSMLDRLLGASIELNTSAEAALHHVKIDPGQFEQVLINLAVNARDAMPEGGRITVRGANRTLDENEALLHGDVAPGDYVLVTVTDTGVGMSNELQRHLFEPFFTTKEFGKGTGLGLATCYGIIKQHGGHIWAESSPGNGAVFSLILPAISAPLSLPRETPPANLLKGDEVVLIAEDEATVRFIAACSLRAAGYKVLEAADGIDALALVESRENRIDLVITDVVMPRMGGRELAERIRAKRERLPILFMSGYMNDEVVGNGNMGSHMAVLQKPFTPEMLVRKAREVLDAIL